MNTLAAGESRQVQLAPAEFAAAPRLRLERKLRLHQRSRARQKQLALPAQPYPPARSLEQAQAQLLLQRLDVLGQARLAHEQPRRRLRIAACVRQHDEFPQPVRIHALRPLRFCNLAQ